jgi:hypothetical protein
VFLVGRAVVRSFEKKDQRKKIKEKRSKDKDQRKKIKG